MRLVGALLLIWFALGVPAMAQEAPTVGFRVGSHPTYGRVVMDWPEPATYRAEVAGNRLILRFDAPARYDLSGALRLPKNVESLSAIDGGIMLQAPPGTQIRHFVLGNRVVIDVVDGAETSEATPPVGTASPPTAAPARAASTPAAPATTPPPAQAGGTQPPSAPRPTADPPATPAARPPPTAPPPREAAPPTSQAATASAPVPSEADVSRAGPGTNRSRGTARNASTIAGSVTLFGRICPSTMLKRAAANSVMRRATPVDRRETARICSSWLYPPVRRLTMLRRGRAFRRRAVPAPASGPDGVRRANRRDGRARRLTRAGTAAMTRAADGVRRGGRVVMQRTANPRTAVRFRPVPPLDGRPSSA